MDAIAFLAHLTRKQVDSLFRIVSAIPADKLDWQPTPETRSVRDQLQEIATVQAGVPDAIKNRKLEMSQEDFGQWIEERKKITDIAELERLTREATEKLLQFAQSVPAGELEDKVEMPWPGDFRVADLLAYHYWNMSYHEGQITYIATMLGVSPSF